MCNACGNYTKCIEDENCKKADRIKTFNQLPELWVKNYAELKVFIDCEKKLEDGQVIHVANTGGNDKHKVEYEANTNTFKELNIVKGNTITIP